MRENILAVIFLVLPFTLAGCHTDSAAVDSAKKGDVISNVSVISVGEKTSSKDTNTGDACTDDTNTNICTDTKEADDVMQDNLKDDEGFYISEITDEIFDRIYGLSFKEECTTRREDLRYLHILYVDFEGNTQNGELIVNERIADTTLDIFEKLYEAKYQIESVKLVDEFGADDEASMAANNSSAFNFRFISHTTTVSKHGLGLAIDINPLYNPYIKEVNGQLNIEPQNSGDYVDRTKSFSHKIDENDLAFKLFTEAGFNWGGSWTSCKDYQHFEYPN